MIRSSPNPITYSVLQGLNLGPILFLLYFNDFENCLKRFKVINVFLPGSYHEIEQSLNFQLNNISNYLRENELVIHLKPAKTESIIFGTKER